MSNQTNTLADALPREIARVSAIRDRYRDMLRDHPELGIGMQVTIYIMQNEIEQAVRAAASGNVVAMITAHESLKGYSDE